MPKVEYKVGDLVAEYSPRGMHGTVHVTSVARLTPTQYITERGTRYRRDTGRVVGNHYGAELLPADDPHVLRTIARNTLSSVRYQIDRKLANLSTFNGAAALDELAEISALLDKARAAVTAAMSQPQERTGHYGK